MATIGTIITKLRAETGQHDRGMRRAGKSMGFLKAQAGQLKSMMLTGLGFFAVIRVMKFAIRESIQFQKTMASVSTMLEGTASKQVQQFSRDISFLAIATGQATKTLGKGLFDILSASVDASKAIAVLRTSSRAAVAGLTDTGIAADAITTILNAYSLSSERAVEVSDIFFATVKRGKTTFGELAPNIGKVTAVASAAGVRFETVGAALATMTRNGIQTDQAITALLSTITVFLKPSDDARRIAKQFGIELNTATLKAKGLDGVLRQLTARGATIEDLGKIFPKKGLIGAAALSNDMKGFAKDLELLANSADKTTEAFVKMADTTESRWDRFVETFKGTARTLGNATAILPTTATDAAATAELELNARVDALKSVAARRSDAQANLNIAKTTVDRVVALRELIAVESQFFGRSTQRLKAELALLEKRIPLELKLIAIEEKRARAAKAAAAASLKVNKAISDMQFNARQIGVGANTVAARRLIRGTPGISEVDQNKLLLVARLLDKAAERNRKAAEAAKAALMDRKAFLARDVALQKAAADKRKDFAAGVRESLRTDAERHKDFITQLRKAVFFETLTRAEAIKAAKQRQKEMRELARPAMPTRLAGAQEVGAGFRGFAAAFRNADPLVKLEEKQLRVGEQQLRELREIRRQSTRTQVAGFN